MEGEIRNFPDKKKLKEFVNTKPVLQQMVKGLLQEEEKEKREKERKKNKPQENRPTIKLHYIHMYQQTP